MKLLESLKVKKKWDSLDDYENYAKKGDKFYAGYNLQNKLSRINLQDLLTVVDIKNGHIIVKQHGKRGQLTLGAQRYDEEVFVFESKNNMKKSEFRKLIREEIKKQLLTEVDHSMHKIDTEMKNFIEKLKTKDPATIDRKISEKYTDGEMLAMFLKPYVRYWATLLDDAKGFRNQLKKGL